MKDSDGSSNFELVEKAKKLRLNNFRGVFMRDQLNFTPLRYERGILNLNTNSEPGSHWVSWFKHGDEKYYFDSFGVTAPREVVEYLKPVINIHYVWPELDRCEFAAVVVADELTLELLVRWIQQSISSTDRVCVL